MNLRRITVAIDFGPATDALVEYAGHLALDLEADVHLVHVHQLFADGAFTPASFLAERERLGELQKIAQRIRELTNRWSKTSYIVEYGPIHAAILRAARGADLLLVGQTKSKGFWRLVMGQVAEDVIQEAPCPILVVPAGVKWIRPTHLALAVDADALGESTMNSLRWITSRYESRLDVFHRYGFDGRRPGELLEEAMHGLSYTYHFDREEGDLIAYILDAAAGVQASWVCLVHRRRPRWREWLRRSDSARVAELAERPALILQEFRPERTAETPSKLERPEGSEREETSRSAEGTSVLDPGIAFNPSIPPGA